MSPRSRKSPRWAAASAALLLLLALVLAPARAARADAVSGPPSSCPPGARGATSHNGPWCEPTTCKTDADCGKSTSSWEKNVCREQPLCVETRSEPSQSGWTWGAPITRRIAHGVCDENNLCTPPSVCEIEKRCVTTRTLLPTGKCAVASPGAPSGAPLPPAAALALLAAAALTRRRARPIRA